MDTKKIDRNALHLRHFLTRDAASIITWPQSIIEARWWAGLQANWPLPSNVVQRWHDDPDVRPFILTDGATLFAYGELWNDAEEQEVELARLIVAPGHRGQGLGVALVRLLLEEASDTGYGRAFLRVVPDNHVARNCYLRAGFTPLSPAEQQSFNREQPLEYLWMSHPIPNKS
jgi:ribosomal protein S18 acetylase RimI-like enzyme